MKEILIRVNVPDEYAEPDLILLQRNGNTIKHFTDFEILPSLPIEQRKYSCGCVSCICEDEVQCHGCGARSCGGGANCKAKSQPIERGEVVSDERAVIYKNLRGWAGTFLSKRKVTDADRRFLQRLCDDYDRIENTDEDDSDSGVFVTMQSCQREANEIAATQKGAANE